VSTYLSTPLVVGTRLDAAYLLEEHMLTHHVPGRPGLLMTPSLIALLEETAARLVRPRLADGAAAVGTWVGVHHTGAATLGESLAVSATVTAVRGRRITYDVSARVDARPVGHGEIGFTLVRTA
jgi:predicted thioesterase